MENNNLEKKQALDKVKALEEGAISPKELSKGDLKECIRVMKNREYSNSEMGQLLGMTSRNVLRYTKELKKENALVMSADSQREFVGEVINNFRAQYSRLIRISYSDGMSDYERTRAIFAACQIKKDAIEIMERLGYLNKKKLEEAEQKDNLSLWDPRGDPLISVVDKLLPQQREKLLEFIKSEPGYTEEKLFKIAKLFISENKKLGLYGADGNLQTN